MPVDRGRYPHEELSDGDAPKPPIVADPPSGPVSSLADKRREWLRRLGFVDSDGKVQDPFPHTASQAEGDTLLDSCFMPQASFDDFKGPFSAALCARSGDGKTACRRMLVLYANEYLPVEYVRVSNLDTRTQPVSVEEHAQGILKAAIECLFSYLCKKPDAFTNLNQDQQVRVTLYLDGIVSVQESVLDRRLQEQGMSVTKIREAIQRPIGFISYPPRLPNTPLVRLTTFLLQPQPEAGLRFGSHLEALESFGEMVHHDLGLAYTCILVDPQTQSLQEWQHFFRKLLDESPLQHLDQHHIYLKLLLPAELRTDLVSSDAVRRGTIRICSPDITWQEEQLVEWIQRRLSFASNGKYSNLASLRDPQDQSTKDQSEWERIIVHEANRSPREVLKICSEIFDAHVRNAEVNADGH